VEVKNANAVLFVDVNFDGSVLGHFYVRVRKGLMQEGIIRCHARVCKTTSSHQGL
jgi:hypothetical protein